MHIRRKILQTALVGIFIAPNFVFAQSRIQCFESSDGSLVASEQWRNTLGRVRADALCDAPRKEEESQLKTKQAARDAEKKKAESTFSVVEGENLQQLISRWATSAGINEVNWDVNERANFIMKSGAVKAQSFQDALEQIVEATNKKISLLKSQQGDYASFLNPIEVVVYRNQVMSVQHKL